MAFSNGFGERKNEEFPFRAPQSPPNESSFGDYPANIRSGANRMALGSQTDERRASLQRRFTTESGRVPTMAPIGQQVAEPIDRNSTEHHKLQLVEQKRLECEMLREHRRRFAAEMQLLDLRQHSNEQELLQMKQDLNRANAIMGPQSEPTTPPEYRDSGAGFPSVLSRPNRYSSSSLASPPGLNHRISNASSQITSPPSHRISAPVIGTKMPSKSVPGSRRNSDENEPEAIFDQDPIGSRPSAA
ncbi:MAG: hypothetical protein M1825_005339 [Sarcosagium campestre]|nr:MAG: hypothetical protein M1825_005339 [Sarcosagium campestre]